MILGRIIEQISAECCYRNDNSAYLPFLIKSPDPYFFFTLVSEQNSGIITNILMVHGRIMEQVNLKCHMQE